MNNLTDTYAAAPEIGADQISLLERLSNACAVSGDEGEVRLIVKEQLAPIGGEIKIDALGNLVVHRPAYQPGALKVLVAAHMDEVGFMLVEGDEGMYQFRAVGGIDLRQLPGKPVLVGKDHVPGVIGARAIHLTTSEERRSSIPLDALRIDLGLDGKGKAAPGDRATFATRFRRLGPSLSGK